MVCSLKVFSTSLEWVLTMRRDPLTAPPTHILRSVPETLRTSGLNLIYKKLNFLSRDPSHNTNGTCLIFVLSY